MTSPSASETRILRSNAGFGLVAILVVLVLLGLGSVALYAVIAPSLQVNSADETQRKVAFIKIAVARFRVNHATATPASLADLVTPVGPVCAADIAPASPTYKTLQGWCGPYLDQPVNQNPDDYRRDGWGILFQYDSAAVTLKSCGPDRVCGGASTDDLIFAL